MTRRTVAPSLLVRNARVVTVDADRRVLSPGYLAVADDRIIGVGPDADCPHDRAERVIDATGKALLPGFVNAHTHAIHILMRGGLSDDRALYDWLFNVVLPGLRAYGREDVEVAAKLYCLEALSSGVATFVDHVEFPTERWDMAADTAIGVYRDAGLRVMFARMFYDHTPDDFVPVIEAIQAKEPEVRHDPGDLEPTAEALASIERLMRRHHGSADGRVQVWPSPGVARFCTPQGLLGARDLARRFGTMVTLHLAHANLVPCHSVASVLVYQANGTEVDTVVVDGRVLLEGRRMPAMAEGEEAQLLARAQAASERIAAAARLAGFPDRGWPSIRGV